MIKTNSLKTNIIFIVISIVISILALSTIMLIDYGKNTKEITIKSLDDNSIQISEIMLGGTKYPLNSFVTDGVEYNEEYTFLSVLPEAELVIKRSALENIKVTFIKNEGNAKLEVKVNDKTQTIDTNSKNIDFVDYKDEITVKEILYNQITNINKNSLVKYILILLFSFIIAFLAFKFISKFLNLLSKGNIKWYQVLLFIACVAFIFQCSIYVLLEIFNFCIIIPEVLILIFLMFKYKDLFKKTENIFLIFALFIGLNFVFILPPFHVPDEGSHYIRAYNMTQSPSDVKKYVENNHEYNANIYLPSTISDTLYEYNIDIHSIDYKLSVKKVLSNYLTKIENFKEEDRILTWFGNTSTLNPFCYILAALAVGICRIFNTSVVFSLILGRIFNLCIFIIGVFYSIKNIPIFKKVLMVIGLLPITLQQAAAINQDSITNTILFITFAFIIKLICDKDKIQKKEIGLLYILGILLAFCKLVYFPILLLAFIIPTERFKNKKTKYLTLISLLVLNLFLTAFGVMTMSTGVLSSNKPYYTFSTVLHHPFRTIGIFINTFLERGQLDLLGGLINGFAWSTKWERNLYALIMQIMFLILFVIPDTGKFDKKIQKKANIIILLSAILIFGFIYSSLLVNYSPLDTTTVAGLQSRYFITVVLLLLCVLPTDIFKIKIKNQSMLYNIFFIISFAIVVFTIAEGFYV